jgi:autotransporter-associated beta strand protein
MFTPSSVNRSQRAAFRLPGAFLERSLSVGRKILAVSIGLSVAAMTGPAYAATSSWTGATDASWGDANWSPAAPGTGDIASFGSLATANLNTTLSANTSIAGLQVTGASGSVTIGNSGANTFGLTLGSGGIDLSSADQNNLTISSGLALSGSTGQTWSVSAGRTLTFNTGTFTRNLDSTVFLQNSGTVIGTNLPGSTTTIVGPWMFTGADTSLRYVNQDVSNDLIPYTGATQESSFNSLNIAGSATTNFDLSAAGTALSGGRLVNTLRWTGGAGTLAIQTRSLQTYGLMNAGTGNLTFSYSGAGVISIGNTTEALANPELDIATNSYSITIPCPITNYNFGSATPSSVVFASPQGGSLILSAANTYTGGTVLNSGILALEHFLFNLRHIVHDEES